MGPKRWTVVALISVLALALAGCAFGASSLAQGAAPAGGGSSSSQAAGASPTQATGQPVQISQNCTPEPGAPTSGDLALGTPSILSGTTADYMLPGGLPTTQPLTVTMQDNAGVVLGAPLASRPVVQPVAFVLSICNTSATQTHRLTSFGVQLDTLESFTGALNVMNGCALLYTRPHGSGGACASGSAPAPNVAFQFAASAVPQARVTQTPGSAITLAPHQGASISFGVKPPAGPAVMTYRLGLGVDGAAVSYPAALGTPAAIIAPVARRWAGTYCTTTQMQAQIPATIPAGTFYVCPKL